MKASVGSIVKLTYPRKGYFKVIRHDSEERRRYRRGSGQVYECYIHEYTVVKMVMHPDGRICGRTQEHNVGIVNENQAIDDQWIENAIEASIEQWENLRKMTKGETVLRTGRRR